MAFAVEVVDVIVPLLLGLDFLDEFSVIIDVGRDKLRAVDGRWEIDLVRKRGHPCIVWE